jgi:hypothetical protein
MFTYALMTVLIGLASATRGEDLAVEPEQNYSLAPDWPEESDADLEQRQLDDLIALNRYLADQFMTQPARDRMLARCFAQGTPEEVIWMWSEALMPPPPFEYGGFRWPGALGSPITLHWSIVPDGTPWEDCDFGMADSTLIAKLNADFGSQEVWEPLFQEVFDRWGELTGLSFVKVDDDGEDAGASGPVHQPGAPRGDIRIGGVPVDGDSMTLACNLFPGPGSGGDMTIDVEEDDWAVGAPQYRLLKNMLFHELGHGFGFHHVCPQNSQKVMEPSISLSFLGPQHDDIRGHQRVYGDNLEPNDTSTTATDLGMISINPDELILDVSIDADSDRDWYQFSVSANRWVNITLTPTGATYLTGPQTLACSAGVLLDTRDDADLSLALFRNDGLTQVAFEDEGGPGAVEAITLQPLPAAGTYKVRVEGAGDDIQMYRLEIDVTNPDCAIDSQCDDGNLCTIDTCNPTFGTCSNTPVNCSDGNPCTLDLCDPATGICDSEPMLCDDGSVCTDDACNPAVGCEFTVVIDCSDGDLCTADLCDPDTGECSNPEIGCNDFDACTLDECDPLTGCMHTPNVECDDGNICTDDVCNPATGSCLFVPVNCNDGNLCTTDSCDPATGDCVHVVTNCDDGNACTADACSPATGTCINAPLSCNDGNACTTDSCDPATGCVHTQTACDDNNACTTDSCNAATGACSYTDISCDDNDPCTIDTCNSSTGCVHEQMVCDDGLFCNGVESCVSGACQSGTPPCSGTNACDEANDRCRGLAVNESGDDITVNENGTDGTYELVLRFEPHSTVVVDIEEDDSQLIIEPMVVTFTTANWDIPQTITASAVDDDRQMSDRDVAISHTVMSNDDRFDDDVNDTLTVRIFDDDIPGLVLTPLNDEIVVSEAGDTSEYTIELSSEPSAPVLILIANDGQVSVTPRSITVAPGNWDIPQTVIVSAVNDNDVEGDSEAVILHQINSADVAYNNLDDESLMVTVLDDDMKSAPDEPDGPNDSDDAQAPDKDDPAGQPQPDTDKKNATGDETDNDADKDSNGNQQNGGGRGNFCGILGMINWGFLLLGLAVLRRRVPGRS